MRLLHRVAVDGTYRRTLNLAETNMQSQHGPFAVQQGGSGYRLDNMNCRLFTCQLAKHEGKAIGKVSWKNGTGETKKGAIYKETYHVGTLMRTQNYDNDTVAGGNS